MCLSAQVSEREMRVHAGRWYAGRSLKPGDTLSSRHVSSHKTYVLFSTPSLSLPMRWLSYADLYNLVTWCHIKRSVGPLFPISVSSISGNNW
jgi:hypothetical protein